jgi:alkanesulfonate monooxygenase SsuD/methylene tetrahydromethanopterin reductase-like flavin-dependent oxidoreductase (luciferase family)
MFRSRWAPEHLPAFAVAAERRGFDELWVAEDCFAAGGLTLAAVALGLTERLGVGVGLLPAAGRNAALAAMDIAGLARVHPGRLTTAFGHGVDAWMRQIGARPPDRIALLEESVGAVRALLAGERLTVSGAHVTLADVALDHPPASPTPVLIGTTGPRGLGVAGRVADGVVLPEGSGAAAIRWARGLAGGGRTVVYAWLSVDADPRAACERLRPDVESWARSRVYPHLTELAGLGRDGAGAIDDERIHAVSVCGEPARCASALRELWEAGADSVVLLADDAQLDRFAAEVRPLLA